MSGTVHTNGVKCRSGLVRDDLRNYCPASNLAFNEKIKLLQERGETIYHFGFGQAPFPVFEEMVKALKENAHQNAYLPVAGIPELRDALANFHKRYDNLQIDSSQIIVGPGTKELIFLLLTVFKGDVLVVSPSWTTYKPQAQLAHHKPYTVETSLENSWRVTPEALKKTIQENNLTGTKILILCNPDNPTGTCYEKEHLQALSEACRQNDVLVISDEIYGRLHYKGCHQSIAKFYPEGTILSSGMSKWASAGGWRLGYHIFPKELAELQNAVRSAASHSYSCAPAPMQYAVAKALTNTEAVDQYIKHTTRIMEAVGGYCSRELSSVGVKVLPSTGGYYIFPDFDVVRPSVSKRGINTGDAMCQAMFKEAKVALMSGGPAFLRPESEFTTRLCYVNFDGTEALRQSRQIGLQTTLNDEFVAKYAKPVYDGIQALKTWVKAQTQV